MIRLLTAVLLFASFHVMAQKLLLNEFEDGTPAKAGEVNYNFDALNNEIAATKSVLPPSDCSTDQIIRWNGTAWACATDPFANLSCEAGDSLTYDGSEFTCECVPPGESITDSNFREAISDWFTNGDASIYGPITRWCTGNVTDMSRAFADRDDFNEDLSGWNTSNVTDMSAMFKGARAFNQRIGRWNTSNVLSMDSMFWLANNFNREIGDWDTSKVVNMQQMFTHAHAFNQDIGAWDTSNVTNMRIMFAATEAFNQDIGAWDTSNVWDMSEMFSNAQAFNQDIGSWNTSNVGNMDFMFNSAHKFNQDLSSWDGSSLLRCGAFADDATAWLAAYDGSIATTPPLSPSLVAAGCGTDPYCHPILGCD